MQLKPATLEPVFLAEVLSKMYIQLVISRLLLLVSSFSLHFLLIITRLSMFKLNSYLPLFSCEIILEFIIAISEDLVYIPWGWSGKNPCAIWNCSIFSSVKHLVHSCCYIAYYHLVFAFVIFSALFGVGFRSVYTLLSPNPTSEILLSMLSLLLYLPLSLREVWREMNELHVSKLIFLGWSSSGS